MSVKLTIPALGESVTEASVSAWFKKVGERVVRDEPVVSIESEKATVELPAPVSGVLSRILREAGSKVAVGDDIAEFEAGAAEKEPQAPAPGRVPTGTPALQAVARASGDH